MDNSINSQPIQNARSLSELGLAYENAQKQAMQSYLDQVSQYANTISQPTQAPVVSNLDDASFTIDVKPIHRMYQVYDRQISHLKSVYLTRLDEICQTH